MKVLRDILLADIWITDKLRNFPVDKNWREAVIALSKNIKDPRYQYIFKPITVVSYGKQSHIRSNVPPIIYRISDGRKRYCVHRELGLKTIKAYVIF